MATGVTTTSEYGSMSDAWAQRALLQRPKPNNIHNLFCKQFTLPAKNTTTMAFRRQENLNSDPVTLAEDADPAPEQLVKYDVQVEIQEFGKVVLLGKKVLLVVEDDTAASTADNLTQCMHTMLDKVTRDVIDSAVPQFSCLNGANGNLVTELTQPDVDRVIAYLDEGNTEKMTPIIEGSSKFGTGPVEDAFWVLAHVALKPDIRDLDAFVPTAQYGSQESVLKAEFGSTDEARWVTSTLVNKSAASPAIYSNTFIGADAIGAIKIDEVATEMIMKPLGFNDYLNRFQSMGFNAWFNALVLDDSHIATLLSSKA